jgi:hypothetical protein
MIEMITDLLKTSDTYEQEAQKAKKVRPAPKMDIHTIMGDMKRWYEGEVFYSDYKIDEKKYNIIKAYYDEKEGITDDKG